jgi:hypothetical protein
MRQGLTMTGAGFVLAVLLLGAGPDGQAGNDAAWLDDRFGTRIAPIWLLMRPDVQGDLQLDQRQIADAKDKLGRLLERLLPLRGKKGSEVDAQRRAIDDDMAQWFRKALSEKQFLRLTQIDLQWEGVSALHRMAVGAHLDLSGEQSSKLEHLISERDERRASGLLTPVESENFSRRMLEVLSPAQRTQWDQLLGPPCHFSFGRPAAAPRKAAG